jgi:GH35 family endo-1,4-beta-xylanase
MARMTLIFTVVLTLLLSSAAAAAPAPAPADVPVYRNSFEGMRDLAAGGITSKNARISATTQTFNYPGPGTALQVKGTLAAEAYSSLDADFSLLKLAGQPAIDFSNKTLGISFFIPPNSPIQTFDVILRRDDKTVVLAAVEGTGWVDLELDMKKVVENRSWTYTNLTQAEALELIRSCPLISFVGARNESGLPLEAEFYIDDLKWIGMQIDHIPLDDAVDSLRKYAAGRHFKFGLFNNYTYVFGSPGVPADPWFAYEIAQEGVLNSTSFFPVLPDMDTSRFDYSQPQDSGGVQLYAFGDGNALTPVGYALGQWYTTVPQWMRDLAFPDKARDLLLYSIEKDLRYTRGKHPIWVLFNEAVQGFNGAMPNAQNNWPVGLVNRQNTTSPASDCCYSPWSADLRDDSLIRAAFVRAREVDPDATLLFNGQGNEVMGWKVPDFYYQFTSTLKAQGVPIDGVGFEMHNYITPDGKVKFFILSWPYQYEYLDLQVYLQRVAQNVKRFAAAGLKVAFTEVDGFIKVDDLNLATAPGRAEYAKRLQAQASYYAGLMKIALENSNVILYRLWEITEKYPGGVSILYPGYGNAGIFDRNYHPKPSYDALLKLLKTARVS